MLAYSYLCAISYLLMQSSNLRQAVSVAAFFIGFVPGGCGPLLLVSLRGNRKAQGRGNRKARGKTQA